MSQKRVVMRRVAGTVSAEEVHDLRVARELTND